MKTFVAGLDRVVAVIAGAALLAGGGIALAWQYDVPWARETLSRFERARIAELPQQGWWVPTLAIVVAVAVVAALVLLIGASHHARPERRALSRSHTSRRMWT